MSYIFLDESGDLGFNPQKKSSKYFIVTILANKEKKPLEKIVKKIHSQLRKKVKKMSGGVLHCTKEKPVTRKRLLQYLAKTDSSIMTICLTKSRVHTKLQDEKHVLYNYVTNILLDRILTKKLIPGNEEIELIISKRETNRFLNDNFTLYLKNQAKQNHNILIEIVIKTPAEEKSLQVVDFASWSLFNKYENKRMEYYEILKKIIVEENMLFPEK
jgi:hypothetical protein